MILFKKKKKTVSLKEDTLNVAMSSSGTKQFSQNPGGLNPSFAVQHCCTAAKARKIFFYNIFNSGPHSGNEQRFLQELWIQ